MVYILYIHLKEYNSGFGNECIKCQKRMCTGCIFVGNTHHVYIFAISHISGNCTNIIHTYLVEVPSFYMKLFSTSVRKKLFFRDMICLVLYARVFRNEYFGYMSGLRYVFVCMLSRPNGAMCARD